MIGYNEKVNKLIIILNNGEKIIKNLGVYGINELGSSYTYYDKQMNLHIVNTKDIQEIKLYSDNKLIINI